MQSVSSGTCTVPCTTLSPISGAVWYSHPDALTDICQSYCGWHNLGKYYGGDLTETDQDNGGLAKFPFIANGDGNGRAGIWRTIREGWIFIENLNRVPDLSESEKSQLRGEVYVIMASRYLDAFSQLRRSSKS